LNEAIITTLLFGIPYTILVGIVAYLIYKVEKLEGKNAKTN
jgi:hypothetical protein